MTTRPLSLDRIITLLWAVAAAASLAGCGRTLVFAERDGINLAIRANASSTPPIEVNFGLDRTIATIVPPVAESRGHPSGEGVNMFAGFQVEQPTSPDLNKPIGVDVKIDTQFASGAAAKNVSDSPPLVARIVNVRGVTFQRTPEFVGKIKNRQQLIAAIDSLSDGQAVAVATSMLPALATRPPDLRNALAPLVPRGGRIPPVRARTILDLWAAMETVNSVNEGQWETALAQAKQ